VALERPIIPRLARDPPSLGNLLHMITHRPAGDPVGPALRGEHVVAWGKIEWRAAKAAIASCAKMSVSRFDASAVRAIEGRLMTSAPPTIVRSVPPPSIPAAAKVAVMLVEHARTTENAGTVGLSLASSQVSRAILLQPKFGITVPQTRRSCSACAVIAYTTGTDNKTAS
jgi:hypothetical protein